MTDKVKTIMMKYKEINNHIQRKETCLPDSSDTLSSNCFPFQIPYTDQQVDYLFQEKF